MSLPPGASTALAARLRASAGLDSPVRPRDNGNSPAPSVPETMLSLTWSRIEAPAARHAAPSAALDVRPRRGGCAAGAAPLAGTHRIGRRHRRHRDDAERHHCTRSRPRLVVVGPYLGSRNRLVGSRRHFPVRRTAGRLLPGGGGARRLRRDIEGASRFRGTRRPACHSICRWQWPRASMSWPGRRAWCRPPAHSPPAKRSRAASSRKSGIVGGLHAALRLLVGVIEVPGGVAIKGGRPSQASVQLGPGMFVDPATGLSQVRAAGRRHRFGDGAAESVCGGVRAVLLGPRSHSDAACRGSLEDAAEQSRSLVPDRTPRPA